MNSIEEIRRWAAEKIVEAELLPDEHSSDTSPSGLYGVEADMYAISNPGSYIGLADVRVLEKATGREIVRFIREDDRFWHIWVTRNRVEYLVCSEALQGQTVIDLTHAVLASHVSEDDPFIWTEFHPSGDASLLAVIGCYWGTPYLVTVYNFRDPLSLPLPVVGQWELPNGNGEFGEWISERAFTLVARDGSRHTIECS